MGVGVSDDGGATAHRAVRGMLRPFPTKVRRRGSLVGSGDRKEPRRVIILHHRHHRRHCRRSRHLVMTALGMGFACSASDRVKPARGTPYPRESAGTDLISG